MSKEILYQERAEGATKHEVAERFAARYWAEPREIEVYDWENDRFRLANGFRVYCVDLREIHAGGDPRRLAPVYQITVL